MAKWETIFDSTIETAPPPGTYPGCDSELYYLSDGIKLWFTMGDSIRLTVNGASYIYTANHARDPHWGETNPNYFVGNEYLMDSDASDNGGDFCINNWVGLLPSFLIMYFYSRTPGVYTVKIERQIDRWETLFDGNTTTASNGLPVSPGAMGELIPLGEYDAPIIKTGDTVKLTVGNYVAISSAQVVTEGLFSGTISAGNGYLFDSDIFTDDGGNYAITSAENFAGTSYGLSLYTRNPGTYTVKVERLIPAALPEIDHTAMVQGWIVGKLLAAMRGKKEPVAYLYNGVRLPSITEIVDAPDWFNKETYSYACIVGGGEDARLYLSTSPLYIDPNATYKWLRSSVDGHLAVCFGSTSKPWECYIGYNYTADEGITLAAIPMLWSSYDMLNTDGTLYLAASEPVPVYE